MSGGGRKKQELEKYIHCFPLWSEDTDLSIVLEMKKWTFIYGFELLIINLYFQHIPFLPIVLLWAEWWTENSSVGGE